MVKIIFITYNFNKKKINTKIEKPMANHLISQELSKDSKVPCIPNVEVLPH